MTNDTETLTLLWNQRFGQPPPLVDAELMRALLAENEETEPST